MEGQAKTFTGQRELGLVLPRPRLVDELAEVAVVRQDDAMTALRQTLVNEDDVALVDEVLVERPPRLPAAAFANDGDALRHDQVGDDELPRDLQSESLLVPPILAVGQGHEVGAVSLGVQSNLAMKTGDYTLTYFLTHLTNETAYLINLIASFSEMVFPR